MARHGKSCTHDTYVKSDRGWGAGAQESPCENPMHGTHCGSAPHDPLNTGAQKNPASPCAWQLKYPVTPGGPPGGCMNVCPICGSTAALNLKKSGLIKRSVILENDTISKPSSACESRSFASPAFDGSPTAVRYIMPPHRNAVNPASPTNTSDHKYIQCTSVSGLLGTVLLIAGRLRVTWAYAGDDTKRNTNKHEIAMAAFPKKGFLLLILTFLRSFVFIFVYTRVYSHCAQLA